MVFTLAKDYTIYAYRPSALLLDMTNSLLTL